MINQIEIHPKYQQKTIQEFCIKNDVLLSSWATLQYGKICYDDKILELAKKYSKSPAQIVLRWHIQHSHITVTRSTKIDRLKENIDIFNFALSQEDMTIINSFDKLSPPTWPKPFGINI